MTKPTDVRPAGVELYFLPVETRVPLKFGPETLTSVTCARVRMRVADGQGRVGRGLGRDAAQRAVGLAERASPTTSGSARSRTSACAWRRPGPRLPPAATRSRSATTSRSRRCRACLQAFNAARAAGRADALAGGARLLLRLRHRAARRLRRAARAAHLRDSTARST